VLNQHTMNNIMFISFCDLRGARHLLQVAQQAEAGDVGAPCSAVSPQARRRARIRLLHRFQRPCIQGSSFELLYLLAGSSL